MLSTNGFVQDDGYHDVVHLSPFIHSMDAKERCVAPMTRSESIQFRLWLLRDVKRKVLIAPLMELGKEITEYHITPFFSRRVRHMQRSTAMMAEDIPI